MSHPRESTSQPASEAETLPPGAVLATFVETLLSGKRVALLGDSASELGAHLAEASGRRVHVFDPDASRAGVTIATRKGGGGTVTVTPLDDGLDDHLGAFDAVIVPDLTIFGDLPTFIPRLSALVSKRGLILLATSNPETSKGSSVGYYDLYDLVAEHFEHVSMHGQAPFAGFTMANFAVAGEPAVTIDASLMSTPEEPTIFVALGSHVRLDVEPYMLVQVPSSALGTADQAVVDDGHAQLAEAQLQRSLVSAELDKTREREREVRRMAEEREVSNKKLSARVAELQDELDRERKHAEKASRDAERAAESLRRRLRQLEAEQAQQASERSGRDEAMSAALEAQREEIEDAHQEDLDRILDRVADLEGELEEATKKLEDATKKLDEAVQAAEREPVETASAAEVRELEDQTSKLRRSLDKARSELDEARRSLDRARRERDEARSERDEATKKLDEAVQAAEQEPAEAASVAEVRGLEFQISELRRSLDDARSARDEAAGLAKDLRSRAAGVDALSAELDETRTANEELRARLAGGDEEEEHAREISTLEERLVERGRALIQLRREIAESERVGRELLGRLLEAQSGSVVAVAPNGELTTLRAQLEALAQRCSRYEADLQAAAWKIASLDASQDEDDASDHDKLENALRSAHEDLARLKRELEEHKRAEQS